MPQHDPPLVETAAWLDRAVATSRDLCARHANNLPEKSALRGLLTFAQSTPSPAETVLFVRYQAARLPARNRRFLEEVAAELERSYEENMEQVRRFLGVLVRAGIVQHGVRQAGRPAATQRDARPAAGAAQPGASGGRRQPGGQGR
jgi:hypothetical protein